MESCLVLPNSKPLSWNSTRYLMLQNEFNLENAFCQRFFDTFYNFRAFSHKNNLGKVWISWKFSLSGSLCKKPHQIWMKIRATIIFPGKCYNIVPGFLNRVITIKTAIKSSNRNILRHKKVMQKLILIYKPRISECFF